MIRVAIVLAVLAVAGCSTKTVYTEGSNLTVGIYSPVEGQVYGLDVLNYLSGVKVSTPSNMALVVDRTYSQTNSYFWGAIEIRESGKTRIDVKDTVE